MAQAKPATEPITVKPAVNPNTGLVTVNALDGRRQAIPQGKKILLTVFDGAQNQLFRNYVNGSGVTLELPFHNNLADNYSIILLPSPTDMSRPGFNLWRFLPTLPANSI